jgi:electron transport complex protein RnfB
MSELLESVGWAAGIMAGLGGLFSTILAVAYRFLRVAEDPRVERVEGMLPGTNCGACGQPGCRAFAEAVVTGGAAPSACTVSSAEAVEAIADLLGVDAGARVKRVARLHCAGGAAHAGRVARYEGLSTCQAAALVGAGGKACSWGCLGLSDCARACTFDAITMSSDGLPVVDIERCTACGACVDVCPRGLFEILSLDLPLLVQCSLPLAGDTARALCKVACDGCGRCAADAEPGVIEMRSELPVVDPDAGERATLEATLRCPTGAIRWVEGAQFALEEPGIPSRRPHARTR